MTGEHHLRDLLEHATTHEPPPGAGTAEVFSRARSIQRRRRAGVGLAGAATLGVLVAAGVTWSGPAATPEPTDGVAPATAAPAGTPSAQARTPLTATTALDTLRTLLPKGSRVSNEVARKGFASLVVKDAGGRTTVEVNVDPEFSTDAGKASPADLLDRYDCAKRTDPQGTECTAATRDDRTRIVSIDGPADEPGASEIVRRQVDVLGPDGQRVVVTVWNAVDVSSGEVTRPAPALTGAQLQEIATSKRWNTAPTGEGGAPN
ncbi:hypothetical protein [Actinoplanes friuliensis]|jgi:hypothetical protein|uniref:Uncharacterized protein n=1 Tax=Actinoplanes friuliensis DSM 7358 TaxID=1246995 RepID=U5VXE1_9ACTN|nr:hypothetical protein [Actinoplanes friuliensis]AGZ41628.1 hypothetical protein AFR_16750 [Actinoplanes friuliensis DSM 7358]